MSETKVHFKLYKSGKKWLVAAIGVATLSAGLSQAPSVKADTNGESQSAGGTDQTSATGTSQSSNEVPLKSSNASNTTATSKADATASDTQNDENKTNVNASNASSANVQTDTSNNGQSKAAPSNGSNPVTDNANTNATQALTPSSRSAVTESVADTSTTAAKQTVPVIVSDPNYEESTYTAPVVAKAKLEATNAAGTVVSSESNKGSNPSVIVNEDVTDLYAVFTLTNTTDQTQGNIKTLFDLPRYDELNNSNNVKSQTLVADTVNEDTFAKGIPAGLSVSYGIDASNFNTKSLAALMQADPDFKWSDLTMFQVTGSLAPNESYVWKIPLKIVTTNTDDSETIHTYGMYGATQDSYVSFRYAKGTVLQGQYRVVTLVKAATDTTPAEYQQLPAAIQSQMPSVSADGSELTISNGFQHSATASGTTLFSGEQSQVQVDLNKTTIPAILAQNGYTLSLRLGNFETQPTFKLSDPTPTIDGADGMDTSNFAPVIYVLARQVIATKDLQLEAGDSWSNQDNLISAIDDNGAALTSDKITTTVNDPDGIIKNGQVTKNGSFTVTYTVNAGGYFNQQTVTKTATVTVTGAYTVDLVDDNGQTITTLSLYAKNGTNQTVTLPTSFKLATTGATTAEVTLNGDTTTPIKLAVVQTPTAYQVQFVNGQGLVVGTGHPIGVYQDTVDISKEVPRGYQLAPNASATITLPGSPDVISTVSVIPAEVQYTVNFVDTAGNVVGTTAITGLNGQQIDVADQIPNGYTLVNGTMSAITLTPSAVDPIEVQVTNSNTLAGKATPIPAITNDPDATPNATQKSVVATAQIMATNDEGTSISTSSDYKNSGAIIDANAKNVAAVYRLSNSTDQTQKVSYLLILPKYSEGTSSTSEVRLSDNVTLADFTKNLPAGLTLKYATSGGSYHTYAELLAQQPNFKWSDLVQIRVDGQLAAHESYTWTLPLTVEKADLYNLSGVEHLQVMNLTSWSTDSLPFRFAKSENADMQGQYLAVTQNQSNHWYEYVSKDIQALMPELKPGDITYRNFYGDSGNGATNLFSGGNIIVNLDKTGIVDLVKDKGYSVLLNADGTPGDSNYVYTDPSNGTGVTISGGTSTDTTTYVPGIYITLRKVVSTQDATLKQGSTWNPYVGLTKDGVRSDHSNAGSNDENAADITYLTPDKYAKNVTVTLSDPSFVKDGKLVKTGTFTVTYAYQLADDYYGKGEPYVISNTATITVDGDYTINFVDPSDPTTILKTVTVSDARAGDTENVKNAVPTDYELADGQAETVMLGDDPTQATVVNVIPVSKTYTVNYVTSDGQTVKTETVAGRKGASVDLGKDVPTDYSLSDPASAQVTLSGDNTDPLVVQVAQDSHEYTVNFVDDNGQTVGTTTLQGHNGDSADVTEDIPADYQLAEGASAQLTLSDPATAKTIKVTQQTHDYTVNFVDDNGQTVGTTTLQGHNGDPADVTEDIPADYQLAEGASAQLTLSDPDTAKTVKVTQQTHDYTVNFVDDNGQTVGTVTLQGHNGDSADVTKDIPADYQLAEGASAQLTLSDPETAKTVKVTQQTHDYTVNFVNENGQTVGTTTLQGHNGDSADVTKDIPADYQLAEGASAQLTLSDPATAKTVKVTQQTHDYTVNFVDDNGQTVGTTTLQGHNGDPADVTEDIPADYQLAEGASAQLTLSDPATAKTVKVTQQTHDYTVNFVDDNGQTVKTVTVTGHNGETWDLTAQLPADYQLAANTSATVTLIDPATVKTVKVDLLQKTYTVNFMDDQQNVVKTMTLSGVTGETVDFTTDVPAGYHLLGGVSGTATLPLDAQLPITVNVLKDAAASQGPSSQGSTATSTGSTASQADSIASQATSHATSTASPATATTSQGATIDGSLAGNTAAAASPATQIETASVASSATPVKAVGAAATVQAPREPATTEHDQTLPQTDDQTAAGATALGLTALLGMLGLAGVKKRERH